MKMRRKCRLWWPKHLLSSKESSSGFLLGWYIATSAESLDIIVAFTCSEVSLSRYSLATEEIIHDTNGNMPKILQEKSMFSVLGHFVTDHSGNSLMVETEEDHERKFSNSSNDWEKKSTSVYGESLESWNCGCLKLDGSLKQRRQSSIGTSNWVLMMFDSHEGNDAGIHGLPKLHHIHWNAKIVSKFDVHVIVFEMPSYGYHHFSLSHLSSYDQVKTSIKKPKWVNDLCKKQQLIDLDTAILAINCTATAKRNFERHVAPKRSLSQLSIFLVVFVLVGHLFAMFMASFSTLVYVVIQLFQTQFNSESESWMHIVSTKVFKTAWINIQIRCSQILYWPVFLQENDLRSRSCVEYAEKAAMHRHSMWSTLVVDVLLGNMVSLAVLYQAESVSLSVLNFVHDIANTFLRSGCVWLMGNPAGFKLNTELAGVLGMVSLNAIQIWSTLWIFVSFIFSYIIKALAVWGFFVGSLLLLL